MLWPWLVFAVGVLLSVIWIATALPILILTRHGRYISRVPDGPPGHAATLPRVSVIVPACDEAASIRRCLDSLASQDYPDLEIIAINDRSTDATGKHMDAAAAAAADPRIRVIHVDTLPPGWLGKNHANRIGASNASGDWLLFTDGDVMFQPAAIRRAILHAEREGLDLLSLFPGMEGGGYWETAASCFFGMMYCSGTKLWHARDPLRPDAFAGVGAFNLIRRGVYESIGTHDRLAMEVVDDLKLAKLVKRSGYVTDILGGQGQVAVRWQIGLRGVIRGLEKNAFAGVGYSVPRAAYGVGVLAIMSIGVVAGCVLAPAWWTRIPFVACAGLQMAALGYVAYRAGHRRAIGLAFPVVGAALAYAFLRSAFLTLIRGGIRWRGTFYPLAQLRSGMV